MTSGSELYHNTRNMQLANLSEASISGSPILVHGSLAHAALVGARIPKEIKGFDNQLRDIDVYIPKSAGKLAAENALRDLGFGEPSPIDAGLCELLVIDDSELLAVKKDGVEIEMNDPEGIFSQTALYEVKGKNGLIVRSFTAPGLLAVHLLEPLVRYDSHWFKDRYFEFWCQRNSVQLPPATASSIEEFHRAYKAAYPFKNVLNHASELYVSVVPERLRAKFRNQTHAIMRRHAGRL